MSSQSPVLSEVRAFFGAEARATPLEDQFARYREGMYALMERAFKLGQRNPCAISLFETDKDGTGRISEDLRGHNEFNKECLPTFEFAESFAKRLQALDLFMQINAEEIDAGIDRAQSLQDAESIEPKELAWQVAALENALAEEKEWSRKLADEREKLLAVLRQRGIENPLTASIREALAKRGKDM